MNLEDLENKMSSSIEHFEKDAPRARQKHLPHFPQGRVSWSC